jgi:GAF domain-containing protein
MGTTAYVLRTGERGEISLVGTRTEDITWLGVPLKAEGRTVGVIAVQSYTKDVQYTAQDKDLLAFVGQHVGAALARARAIEETRQRNAELALINSVQEALAGELELQAIYDVVGDKLRDVFDARVIDIAVFDEASDLRQFPYSYQHSRATAASASSSSRRIARHLCDCLARVPLHPLPTPALSGALFGGIPCVN